jgi:AcrR family transcriptional regulator
VYRDTSDPRDRLLDAALQQWADHGWASVTLRGAAATAGVEEAEFRDEFPTDADLLCTIFDDSSEERGSAAIEAMDGAAEGISRWRASIESFVKLVEEDPRHTVVLVQATGSPELQARRRSSYRGFAAVMVSQTTRSSPEPRSHSAAAHFCIGGLTELTLAWMDPATDVDRDVVISEASMLFELVMAGG